MNLNESGKCHFLDMVNDTLIPTIENQQIYVKEIAQIINARYSRFVPIVI